MYVPYPKKDDSQEYYKNPQCVYSLEDIDGGIRVHFHFPPQNTFDISEQLNEETGEYESVYTEKILLPEADRSFDIIFNEHLGRIRNLRTSRSLGDYTLCYTDRFDTARMRDFNETAKRDLGYNPLLNFAVNEDASEVIIFLRERTYKPDYQNAEYVELPNGVWRSYILYLKENSEFCRKKIEKYEQKRKDVIEHVDTYASISYLESQVDALTRLVLKLTTDKLKGTDEYKVLEEADKHSVLDIKDIENISQEFKKDKGNVRTRQNKLYVSQTISS